MKKLAIVLLFVAGGMAGCRRQVVVGSSTGPGAPGAASPREAVQLFLATAKAQDIQAFSLIWGSAEGSALNTMDEASREKRAIILMLCLKHDVNQILGEAPAAGGERVLAVEMKYRDLTRATNFYATRGPQNRWFIRHFDIEPLNAICSAR